MPIRKLIALSLLAAVASVVPAAADVLIKVDKETQTMDVSVDGRGRYSWPVSTGKPGHATPNVTVRPQRLDRDHFSAEWDNAPMPFSIFITDKGHAIHGTNHAIRGRPASHGCIRLSLANAETLYDLVEAQGIGRTRVVVEGDDPVVVAQSPSRATRARYRPAYEDDLYPDAAPVARGYGAARRDPYSYGEVYTPYGGGGYGGGRYGYEGY